MKPQDLVEILKGHSVYIQTHNFPDPDAISSAFGLQKFLKYFGIKSVLCYYGKIDKLSTRRMLAIFGIEIYSKEELTEMKDEDYIVLVDSQKLNGNVMDLIGEEVACIDHHPTFVDVEYQYKDVRLVGACATLIAECFYKEGIPIDANTAAALCYGIKMDTTDFTRGVTDLDVTMFSYLYKRADKEKFSSMFSNTMEFKDLKAYGAAIESIQICSHTGFSFIPFYCPDALVAMISDFILALDVVDVSVVYASRDNGLKFSVRSENKEINAGKITYQALSGIGSGGGHQGMAGGAIYAENMDLLKEDIHEDIRQRFMDALGRA